MKKNIKLILISTIICPFILMMIIVTMLGDSKGSGSTSGGTDIIISESISESVLQWQPLIEKYAEEFGIKEYVPLILAIVQQESGGNTSLDVMQSAEGAFNTKYAKVPNGITDPDYSIWCGVQEIKSTLEGAGVTGPTDLDNISLALQAYNFGSGFLDYAKSRGGYSPAIAQEFSDMWTKKWGKGRYGDPLYVPHVLRYYSVIKENFGNPDNELLDKVVKISMAQQGKPYIWGAAGPDTFDCSGLVAYSYNQSGYAHERTTAEGYYRKSTVISSPEPGDLIFFRNPNSSECHHIGIYIGNNKMVHAPKKNDVVKVAEYLNRSDFIGYGRLQ